LEREFPNPELRFDNGSEIKLDGEELLIMREDEILGIIERAGAATGGSKKSGK